MGFVPFLVISTSEPKCISSVCLSGIFAISTICDPGLREFNVVRMERRKQHR